MRLVFLSVMALAAISSPASAVPDGTAMPGGTTTPGDSGCCAVVELRQYVLKPGKRDALISLFDREFVETQEAVGMRILGQFRDPDRPDRFVWLRGFSGMESRPRALGAFYDGPVWKAHRKKAIATMIDADDVLLLRPVDPPGGFPGLKARPRKGATGLPASVITATIYSLDRAAGRGFLPFYRDTLLPALREAGIVPLAAFESEPAPNNYPRLPVREGENVFVWFAAFKSASAHAASAERLSRSPAWPHVEAALTTYFTGPPQELRLRPTARSRLR